MEIHLRGLVEMAWGPIVLLPEIVVSKDACADVAWYFPSTISNKMTCYVMVFATWSYQGVRAGYEDSTYTNDAATALNVLYRRMFAHSISFAGDPDGEEKLTLCHLPPLLHEKDGGQMSKAGRAAEKEQGEANC
jgi:hypothetical protein